MTRVHAGMGAVMMLASASAAAWMRGDAAQTNVTVYTDGRIGGGYLSNQPNRPGGLSGSEFAGYFDASFGGVRENKADEYRSGKQRDHQGGGIMRYLLHLAVLATLGVAPAQAVERYTEARITQFDVSDNTIVLFLEVISGEAVPIGNGGSNESNKPFLILANSAADIESRKHFLAAALVAQMQGSIMRFRWEDAGENANRIVVLLLRQP